MILSLKEIAEIISRMGYHEEIFLEMLIKTYKERKSDGVIDLVKKLTYGEINLEHFGNNKYVIKY